MSRRRQQKSRREIEAELADCRHNQAVLLAALHNQHPPNIIVSDAISQRRVVEAFSRRALLDYGKQVRRQVEQYHSRVNRFFFDVIIPMKSKCETIDALSFAMGAPGAPEIREKIKEIGNEVEGLLSRFNLAAKDIGVPPDFAGVLRIHAEARLAGVEKLCNGNDGGTHLREVASQEDNDLAGLYSQIAHIRRRELTWRQWLGLKMAEALQGGSDYPRAYRRIWDRLHAKPENDRTPHERDVLTHLQKLSYQERTEFCRKQYHNIRQNQYLASRNDLRRDE